MNNLVVVFDDQHARQRDLPISVYLDIRIGQLTVGYLAAQTYAKRQQLVFQWPLPQNATSAELAKLINTHLALFEQLLDNADVIHHNQQQTGLLDASAKKAVEKLNAIFGLYNSVEKYILCADLSEWLNGKLYHDDYPDVDSFANYILSCDGDNNIYFSSFLNDHDSMVSEILLLWHEDFENGNDLPDYALKTLKNYPLLHTTTNKTARNDIKNHIKKLKSFLLFKKNVYQGTNNQNVQKKLKSQLIKYKRDYPWAFLMLEESNFEDIEQMKIKGSNQREALKYKISSHIVCQCEGFISDSDQEKVVDEILSDCFPPYRARLLTS